MSILYISLALNTAIILFTVFWLKFKSYKPDISVQASLSEAPVTIVLALFSLGLAYFLPVSKIFDSSVGGTGTQSYWFVGVFAIVCALLGCYSLLYTYLKRFFIMPDKLVEVDVLGTVTNVAWDEIKSVRIPMLSKNIRLKTEQGTCNIHSGNTKQFKNFIKYLKDRIPSDDGGDIVRELYNRL